MKRDAARVIRAGQPHPGVRQCKHDRRWSADREHEARECRREHRGSRVGTPKAASRPRAEIPGSAWRGARGVALEETDTQVIADTAFLDVVIRDGAGREAALPSGLHHRPTERRVLAVVGDVLVEAAGLVEGAAPVEDIAPFEEGRRGHDLARQRPVAGARRRWLLGAALHDAESRVGLHRLQPGGQPARLGHAVVVDERDHIGRRRAPPGVARCGGAALALDELAHPER